MPSVESPWYPLDEYRPEPVLKAILDDFAQRFGRRPEATVHYDTDAHGRFRFRVTTDPEEPKDDAATDPLPV